MGLVTRSSGVRTDTLGTAVVIEQRFNLGGAGTWRVDPDRRATDACTGGNGCLGEGAR